MKIGIVTDIHYGPDVETRLGSQAPAQLRTFGEAMRALAPACLLDLGDRINDVTADKDREHTTWVRRTLTEIGVPVYHVFGNHDVANLSKRELGATLGKWAAYEYVDLDGIRLVLLDSQDPTVERIGGTLGTEQLAWLSSTIRGSRQPCLIFCHHPLDEQAVDGHWYFEAHPGHAHAGNRENARRIFEEGGRVLAVFSGHMHWTRATMINGIPYVTIGSIVDGGFTKGRPCGAFAEVTVDGGTVGVRVAGLLPDRFEFGRL